MSCTMSLHDSQDTSRHSSPTRSTTSTDLWSRTVESPGVDAARLAGETSVSNPYPRRVHAADLARCEDFEAVLDVDNFFRSWLELPDPRPVELPARSLLQLKGQRLVLPEGDQPCRDDGRANFVCALFVQLEDDEEFCLVKRLLGKGGCNMSAIANSFDAKIRLRGRGSWHLETLQQEADMPLQIHVSCREFGNYLSCVGSLAHLLEGLYQHYWRFVRSKCMQAPDLHVKVDEWRRSDCGIDLLHPAPQPAASAPAASAPVGSGRPVVSPFTLEVGGGAWRKDDAWGRRDLGRAPGARRRWVPKAPKNAGPTSALRCEGY
ncbi:unnamed protein product [Effrenium voratum]|uniref:KHDC4/BBP-like KH-domain type I domain-containing protein n=1 Tax=Effrenium voratum TaxID=2562239 RepID=A0AA36HSP4_9DINO|nr:unnamed protein product [Effrenium voratum]CAJ1374562.1 unnamed protein product [Effrenium voratum]CAJ1430850.1 unnamed protein product [Effrenium voratum]